jgi:YjbE family integral membrane protein
MGVLLEESIVLFQIIFIDVIMAADNAIIIGLIAANFAPIHRKQIILLGVFAAFVFRFIFAISANYLFEFSFIKIVGGLLLVWIVNDLRRDLFEIKKIKSPTKASKEPSYIQSVYKVLFADLTLSFDNVIGVVAAAKDHFYLMIFGLVLSVVLVGTLASYFAKYVQNHKWIGYVGLIVIFVVALQLIIAGLADLNVIKINEEFKNFL